MAKAWTVLVCRAYQPSTRLPNRAPLPPDQRPVWVGVPPSGGEQLRTGRSRDSNQSRSLLDGLVLDPLEGHHAAGVVALQREVALLVGVVFVREVDGLLAVDEDLDVVAV